LRQCENIMLELVVWGAREIDLAPFVRETIRAYFTRQEHESGISASLENLKVLKKFPIFNNESKAAFALKLELAHSFFYFNKSKEALKLFESISKPDFKSLQKIEERQIIQNIDEQYETLAKYCVGYAILFALLKKDSTYVKELIKIFEVITKKTNIVQQQAAQIRVGLDVFLTALTDHLDLPDSDVYIEQIFDMVSKAALEVQLAFISVFLSTKWQIKLTSIPIIKLKVNQLSFKLLTSSYKNILELSRQRGHDVYLAFLIRVFVATTDDLTKLKELIKILDDQLSSPLSLQRGPSQIINELSYLTWMEVFRNVDNSSVILTRLIETQKSSDAWIIMMYLRICQIQLLSEHKDARAQSLYISILDEVWVHSDWTTKHRLLNRLIGIAPYFGIEFGSRVLEQIYSRWQELAQTPGTPIMFINEVIISIADAVAKLEGDAALSLKLLSDVIDVTKEVINSETQRTSGTASPALIFDGLEIVATRLIKITASPQSLVRLYQKLVKITQDYLTTLQEEGDIKRRRIQSFYPVRLLLTISYGLETLGENTTEILENVFSMLPSLDEHNLNELFEHALTIASESGAQRYFIIEKCTEILAKRNKELVPSSKGGMGIDISIYLFRNIEMLIYIITHSENAVIAAIKFYRGLEEGAVRSEIITLLRKID